MGQMRIGIGRDGDASRRDGPAVGRVSGSRCIPNVDPREALLVRRERRAMNRLVRNLLVFAGVLVAIAAGGTDQAEAQTVSDWGNDTCLECHSEPGLSMVLPSGETLDVTIDEDRWHNSIHAEWDLKCILCHTEITSVPHEPPAYDNTREWAFTKSDGCLVCHRDQAVIDDSVHVQAREEGNLEAAVCSDCHDPHYATDPPKSPTEIPETCRTCHSEIYDRYTESVHGSALTDGNPDVPTCTDCHGVHEVAGPSRGEFHLFSPQVCATCHADEELMGKYGINTDVFNTYVADFHGRTITLFQEITPDQDTNAPVCISCHGVHDIQPADEAGSSVAKENLLATCQHCHPNAEAAFPEAWMSHYSASTEEWPIVFYVRLFYRIIIPLVIGGMVFYVATDLFGRLRRRKERLA
jgi:predicted CXXCH cytochrome family protein